MRLVIGTSVEEANYYKATHVNAWNVTSLLAFFPPKVHLLCTATY